jgi:hypothetical protein
MLQTVRMNKRPPAALAFSILDLQIRCISRRFGHRTLKFGTEIRVSASTTSKIKPDLPGYRSRRHVMRAAESGKKVVQRNPIREIDSRQLSAPFVLVPMKQVVMTD